MEKIQFSTYQEVINLMNQAGRDGESFVFGLDYERSEGFFSNAPFETRDIIFDISGRTNALPAQALSQDYDFVTYPTSFDIYSHSYDRIRTALMQGDSFLANLTVETPIDCSLSLEEIFAHSKAPYRILLPHRFVCFSPERFVFIDQNGRISSNPMKGTIDALLPQAEHKLLTDYKETAEHCTIVDLIRNDLSSIAQGVQVDRFRYIDRIDTNQGPILQMSSEVSGQLPMDWRDEIGNTIDRLLPAGSISGAPKEATVAAIREAERRKRGFYTGIAGLFDGQTLDTAVLIRFVEKTPSGLVFQSGGGITINSNARSEYREVIQKVYLPLIVADTDSPTVKCPADTFS